MHTLSAPMFIEDHGGTGEPINKDLVETGRKIFLGKEIKYALDPIEEVDEEISKEFAVKENNVQSNIDDCNAGNKDPILRENYKASGDQRDESNYQLRRTIKLMNLHQEFVKEDLKVVLGPKRLDSSSSDSCDDDIVIFAKSPDLNESVRDIAIKNDSLIYSTNM